MQEILDGLPAEARIIDLGCSVGSFDASSLAGVTVRVDLKPQKLLRGGFFVQADAAMLPFRADTFDAVFCNHSLEHFDDLRGALGEIGRVAKNKGALFVSVPDAGTLTDRIYRWLSRGADHVNPFYSAREFVDLLECSTGMAHVATRPLFTSFSFLNRENAHAPFPKRMVVFLWGMERALVFFNACLRWLDLHLHTRTSTYGWASFFGYISQPVNTRGWTNVCARCGDGHPSDWLVQIHAINKKWGPYHFYRCPKCRATNFFFSDDKFADFH